MGQRFQIIVNDHDRVTVYHSQWLWGKYAIRRLGTAMRVYNSTKSYRPFVEFLYGSFYRLNDMNSFSVYGDTKDFYRKDFFEVLATYDNDDGYCYIEIKDSKVVSYAFILHNKKQLVSAHDYMHLGYAHDEKQGAGQEKEYVRNMKWLHTLPVTQIVNIKGMKKFNQLQAPLLQQEGTA